MKTVDNKDLLIWAFIIFASKGKMAIFPSGKQYLPLDRVNPMTLSKTSFLLSRRYRLL